MGRKRVERILILQGFYLKMGRKWVERIIRKYD